MELGDPSPLNERPLSTLIESGIPCLEKMVFNFRRTEVDEIISTLGNRLYLSMTTSKKLPEGKGSAKPMAREPYASSGSGVGCCGSRRLLWFTRIVAVAWYLAWYAGFHCFISIPGNYTFSLIHCFVLFIPWWAWWAMAIIFFHRVESMIMWVCLKMNSV